MELPKQLLDRAGQKISPTNNVRLLESPYGKWEVDNVDEDSGTVYLIDGPGTILCHPSQVAVIQKQ